MNARPSYCVTRCSKAFLTATLHIMIPEIRSGDSNGQATYQQNQGPKSLHELFRGSITNEQLQWSETQIRDFVVSRKTANSHLLAAVGIESGADNNLTSKQQ